MWLMPGSGPGVLHVLEDIHVVILDFFVCYGMPGTILGAENPR